jgi:hypothetical protein
VKRSADFEQGRRDGINLEIAIADDRIDQYKREAIAAKSRAHRAVRITALLSRAMLDVYQVGGGGGDTTINSATILDLVAPLATVAATAEVALDDKWKAENALDEAEYRRRQAKRRARK